MSWIELQFKGEDGQLANEYFCNGRKVVIPYPCTLSYECSPYLLTFSPGYYHVELYGGSGGNTSASHGGKGGFTQGSLFFHHKTSLYLFIGGSGLDAYDTEHGGGFNGGGSGYYIRGSGGGATDIRQTIDDLYSRILVAGGGGGAMYNNDELVVSDGGHGGGFNGSIGGLYLHHRPCIATQTGCVDGVDTNNNGEFGFGSNFSVQYHPGAGGGGWYGGGGANGCGGSGGSSYIMDGIKGETKTGVNYGNGYVIISQYVTKRSCSFPHIHFHFFFTLITIIK